MKSRLIRTIVLLFSASVVALLVAKAQGCTDSESSPPSAESEQVDRSGLDEPVPSAPGEASAEAVEPTPPEPEAAPEATHQAPSMRAASMNSQNMNTFAPASKSGLLFHVDDQESPVE